MDSKQEMVDKLIGRNKEDILRKLKQNFIEEDKSEPFLNREYVEETIRVFNFLINPNNSLVNNLSPLFQDKSVYDIVSDIFRHFTGEI